MFDSLDEQMRNDENKVSSGTERMIRWLLVVLVTVVIFGGLYLGIHFLEGA